MTIQPPIIKRARQAVWTLIDLAEIFYRSKVRTTKGIGDILSLDKDKNEVTVDVNKKLHTFKVRSIKLMLRPMTQLNGRNLSVVVNLALGVDSFTYSVKRGKNQIICEGKAYTVKIIVAPQFGMVVSDALGKSVAVRNLGYIMSYLIIRSYDVVGLLKTPYANIVSGVPKV